MLCTDRQTALTDFTASPVMHFVQNRHYFLAPKLKYTASHPTSMVLVGKQGDSYPLRQVTLNQENGQIQLGKADGSPNIQSCELTFKLASKQPGHRAESSLLDNSALVFTHVWAAESGTANNFTMHLAAA